MVYSQFIWLCNTSYRMEMFNYNKKIWPIEQQGMLCAHMPDPVTYVVIATCLYQNFDILLLFIVDQIVSTAVWLDYHHTSSRENTL